MQPEDFQSNLLWGSCSEYSAKHFSRWNVIILELLASNFHHLHRERSEFIIFEDDSVELFTQTHSHAHSVTVRAAKDQKNQAGNYSTKTQLPSPFFFYHNLKNIRIKTLTLLL